MNLPSPLTNPTPVAESDGAESLAIVDESHSFKEFRWLSARGRAAWALKQRCNFLEPLYYAPFCERRLIPCNWIARVSFA
jgi:hypothetical protein